VGRLSHPHPPAGGIGHHNPVLQWSWRSPSQWLVQDGKRQYAAGCTQEVTAKYFLYVKLFEHSFLHTCSLHGFRITIHFYTSQGRRCSHICMDLHSAAQRLDIDSSLKFYMDIYVWCM